MSKPTKTYEVQMVPVQNLRNNPANPRNITADKFENLVKSLREDPQMLALRPIVVDNQMIVQGGNMRLRAIQEIGWDEVPCIIAKDYDEKAFHRFVVKDNATFGEWDFSALTGQWDTQDLLDWGVEGFNPDWAEYEPELMPDTSYEDITAEQIAEKAKELAAKIITEQNAEPVMCPECGAEFHVQR